ncbi:MAG TPA: SDR family oxidoreductase [Pedococcus sp.]|nr:SDR family oxidoreductase [Pedococcus sp.]
MTDQTQTTKTNPGGDQATQPSQKQVWLVTGASRGLGIDIAKAALAAGHAVVATARNIESITRALGQHDQLLAVALDVTYPNAAQAAVAATIELFGHLDVLVNNAGSFQAGFFEEMTPEAFRTQIETTLFGPVNVTRAALPQLRAQRSGLVMTISSTAGIGSAGDFLTAYAASKFGVEGFMEALASEIAPFGIRTMLVEPGFVRTELLTPQSTQYAQPSIADYADRTAATIQAWQGMDGKQGGDPAKLADALVQLATLDQPPARFAAGADAIELFETKARTLLTQADAYRELSSSLAHDDA